MVKFILEWCQPVIHTKINILFSVTKSDKIKGKDVKMGQKDKNLLKSNEHLRGPVVHRARDYARGQYLKNKASFA